MKIKGNNIVARGYASRASRQEMKIISKIDATRRFGPVLLKISKYLEAPLKSGKPLTKAQNQALVKLLRNQAGLIYGTMFKDYMEAQDYGNALGIVKELISLDLEEIKVGKKAKKKDKLKPGLIVNLPGVRDEAS